MEMFIDKVDVDGV